MLSTRASQSRKKPAQQQKQSQDQPKQRQETMEKADGAVVKNEQPDSASKSKKRIAQPPAHPQQMISSSKTALKEAKDSSTRHQPHNSPQPVAIEAASSAATHGHCRGKDQDQKQHTAAVLNKEINDEATDQNAPQHKVAGEVVVDQDKQSSSSSSSCSDSSSSGGQADDDEDKDGEEDEVQDKGAQQLRAAPNKQTGIYKLFDLMKLDLGQQQTNEMKNFYEKMSTQIRELCVAPASSASQQVGQATAADQSRRILSSTGSGKKDKDFGDRMVEGPESQSQLNQVFLLSLLQYQKQKILEESSHQSPPNIHAGHHNQILGSDAAAAQDVAAAGDQNDEEEDKDQQDLDNQEGDSSNEADIDYDERSECLKDEPEEDDLALTVEGGGESSVALQRLKIRCMLKPANAKTQKHLLEKSSNNINPFVAIDAQACTKVTTLIEHMAGKIFKEDPGRFLLKVHQSKFTQRKSCEKKMRVQDLLLAEDPEKLEAMLQCDSAIKLVVKYMIRSENDLSSEADDYSEAPLLYGYADDKNDGLELGSGGQAVAGSLQQLPQDVSEGELMEMLTEVMSIMLFNKDEQLNKYVGTVSQFDLKAKLQHPSDLLCGSKRKRTSQQRGKAVGGKTAMMGVTSGAAAKDNEKSEVSNASQSAAGMSSRKREARHHKAAAQKLAWKSSAAAATTRPIAERIADYQKSQREKLEKQRQKHEQQVQRFILRRQQVMRDRIDNNNYWQQQHSIDSGGLPTAVQQEFASVDELVNFRTNPYFDNLVKFTLSSASTNAAPANARHHQQLQQPPTAVPVPSKWQNTS